MKINKLQYIGLLLCWMMLLPGCSEKELDNYAGPESILIWRVFSMISLS